MDDKELMRTVSDMPIPEWSEYRIPIVSKPPLQYLPAPRPAHQKGLDQ